MSSDWYRRIAEECLEVASDARTSEDADTWRLIAEEWFRIAGDFEAGEEPLASLLKPRETDAGLVFTLQEAIIVARKPS